MDRVVIVGNGGHARACLDAWDPAPELTPAGCVGPAPTEVLGLAYLGDDDQLPALAAAGLNRAFVALGSNALRAAVTQRCLDAGFSLVTIIAPSAQVGRTAEVGPGSIVLHRAVVGAQVRIGRGSIISTAATVDHDCVIGDFVHIAPGVNLAGNVVVEDRSMAEVVGDAGLLVAADDPADIAAGILRAVGPEHDGLGRAARARSAAFTWAHAADQTVQAYRAAIGAQHLAGPPRRPRSVR